MGNLGECRPHMVGSMARWCKTGIGYDGESEPELKGQDKAQGQ